MNRSGYTDEKKDILSDSFLKYYLAIILCLMYILCIYKGGGMVVHGKIQKWGNSLGIRIQKKVADQIDLKEDTEVLISVNKKRIIVTPIQKKKTLEEMLEGVTPENTHGEIDFGRPVGKEIW
jgi:antitoxin MazE